MATGNLVGRCRRCDSGNSDPGGGTHAAHEPYWPSVHHEIFRTRRPARFRGRGYGSSGPGQRPPPGADIRTSPCGSANWAAPQIGRWYRLALWLSGSPCYSFPFQPSLEVTRLTRCAIQLAIGQRGSLLCELTGEAEGCAAQHGHAATRGFWARAHQGRRGHGACSPAPSGVCEGNGPPGERARSSGSTYARAAMWSASLSALDGGPRSATVTTCGQALVNTMTGADFRSFLRRYPEAALIVGHRVASQLRFATRRRADSTGCHVGTRLAGCW